MKVFVPIKRVVDYQAKIKVKADGSGIETEGIKWIVNPFDEIAVEEAVRWKEQGKATEVVVVSIGPDDTATQLRYCMAMGADSAIHVKCNAEVDSDLASKVLTALWNKDKYDICIMGKQAIDSDASQTPQLLAERLKLPHASFASKIVLEGDTATVTREVDGGLETVQIAKPCIVSTDLRLNEPRYAPLPGIMKAKKKPLTEYLLSDLGLAEQIAVKVLKYSAPATRKAGRKVASVEELIKALKDEAKVI
jgi:electron transfer flavoprotein beta subunit